MGEWHGAWIGVGFFLLIVYYVGFLLRMPKYGETKQDYFEALVWPLFAIKWLVKISVEMVIHVFKRLFLEW